MKIGIIADDYTGGTDAASFLVAEGLSCIQVSGPQSERGCFETDAIVVSLKSRTEPVEKAVKDSVDAYRWLKKQGCELIQFKYCSTFDSTEVGNIGPVTDALLIEAGLSSTIVMPSLPVNGREVFYGNLYVKGQPLNESGMKNHPLTPMRDANLMRLMEKQGTGRAELIDYHLVEQGKDEIRLAFETLSGSGIKYIVLDAFRDEHLFNIGAAFDNYPIITGASGLSHGIARAWAQRRNITSTSGGFLPLRGKSVVISGSCSEQTNRQVNTYQKRAACFAVEVSKLDNIDTYSDEILAWYKTVSQQPMAPLISATVDKEQLAKIRAEYSFDVSSRIENLFSLLVKKLWLQGCRNFICAGGETSGSVTQALNIDTLLVGKLICPGVPWVKSLEGGIYLALKSGNFGDDNFFADAQVYADPGENDANV
ncbi:3-oxo-tetronate kinase [Enterobacter cancerogenus]|uniref:3-oxo-tetronate kinase n=1 Tax=Enterobacter cancerogenus TaxID=69218 RepID=UPI0005374EA4|nr:3-oxo-tetronate kinase [Enterobacter cancerogenus]KGT88707.1 hypothetical protein NH00_19050 [Enterobacter cancerogenus]